MKKISISLILMFSILTAYSQIRLADHIKNLEGIWIAEDFLHSFDTTKSVVKSKKAFDPTDPVGLRINTKEIKNGILNVGYSNLHDHFLHPEVSKYAIIGNDTIHEEGHFTINILKSDSLNYHKPYDFYYYGHDFYFTWEFLPDTVLVFYQPPSEKVPGKTIRYKRISQTFTINYQYPNPIYYYTRAKTLVGNYILRDSLNNVISNNFSIGLNGKTKGYTPFNDKIFYFNTDIYCGPQLSEDFILICSFDRKLEVECDKGFIYKLISDNSFQFHEINWVKTERGDEKLEVGKMLYKLTKK